MKKIALSFIPIMLAGFFIPGENCGNPNPHATKFDGPYVLYKNDLIHVKFIMDEHGARKVQSDSFPLSQKSTVTFNVPTDQAEKNFSVQLKASLENEPAEFPAPEKMFILSDIEGNFAAFRKLLQVGGVIDTEYNWTFGNG